MITHRYLHGASVDERLVHWQYDQNTGAELTERFYHRDHQGSIIAMSDASGNRPAGELYTYDAYGNMVTGNTSGQPFRYTGRRWDDETGLYYYRARYYSAELGRFLQTDPIGYEDNMNMYGYTANDPVNNTDPSGLADCGLSIPGECGGGLPEGGDAGDGDLQKSGNEISNQKGPEFRPGIERTDRLTRGNFEQTHAQQLVNVFLPNGHGYTNVVVALTSTGDAPSGGKLLPGIGLVTKKVFPRVAKFADTKVIKPAGNGAIVSILEGNSNTRVFTEFIGLEKSSRVEATIEINPARSTTIRIKGVTAAGVWVTVDGRNFFPSDVLNN